MKALLIIAIVFMASFGCKSSNSQREYYRDKAYDFLIKGSTEMGKSDAFKECGNTGKAYEHFLIADRYGDSIDKYFKLARDEQPR